MSHQTKIENILNRLTPLQERLKLLKRQNTKENNRGFNDGGVSVESEEEKNENQEAIAQLEAQIKDLEVQKAQAELQDIFDPKNKEKNGILENERNEKDGSRRFVCTSKEQAQALAQTIAAKYQEMGFACSITQSENTFTVNIQMPEKFKGQDPASLTPEQLKEVKEGRANERPGSAPSTPRPGTPDKGRVMGSEQYNQIHAPMSHGSTNS